MINGNIESIERDIEVASNLGLSLRYMLRNCDAMANRIADYMKEAMCNSNVACDDDLDALLMRAKKLRFERGYILDKLMKERSKGATE